MKALHNQSVDLSRQRHTDAEWLARGQVVVARDRALSELQALQTAHAELESKVTTFWQVLPQVQACSCSYQSTSPMLCLAWSDVLITMCMHLGLAGNNLQAVLYRLQCLHAASCSSTQHAEE